MQDKREMYEVHEDADFCSASELRPSRLKMRRIAATRPENLASAVRVGVGGPLTMLPGGVVCLNDSSSAMGVAVRKSGVERYILMIEGSRGTTSVVVLELTEAQFDMQIRDY